MFFKHLMNNKIYGIISILGFSFSLMIVILAGVYVQKEYNVDHFHINKDRIFRVSYDDDYSGFAPPFGSLLKDNFPEIECFTRVYEGNEYVSFSANKKFKIDYLMVDSDFFKIFTYRFIKGNVNNVLNTKMSIVLTKSYALKLFGTLPEIGQQININDYYDYTLEGIIEDTSEPSHFRKVDAYVNFVSLGEQWNWENMESNYDNNSFGLYIMEKPHMDITLKNKEILKLFTKVSWLYQKGYANEVIFEPLTSVYFSKSMSPGTKQNSKILLKVLSTIVGLIVVLSMLNYVNLTIAQSSIRCKQMAIKKIMGLKRWKLAGQYIIESFIITFFAYIIALILSFYAEPIFNIFLNTKLNLINSINIFFTIKSLFLILSISVICGIIPALSITNFNLISILKGTFRRKSKGIYLKVLIGFQYIIIISLIICSLFIQKQTSFLRNYNLGFNKTNILSIENNAIDGDHRDAFKQILQKIPGVIHVCFVAGSPLDSGNNNSFTYNNKPLSFQTFKVDTSFFKMMGIEVIPTGVAYSDSIMWLNETAIKTMELPKIPLSARFYSKEVPVYGVVKDFHFSNLKTKIGPANFRLLGQNDNAWSILIKISSENTVSTVNKINKAFADFTDNTPIDITFMDEAIDKWYNQEEKIGTMINYLTIITIIISAMGLFAMSLFYVEQKTKEIGIRKVNGAKIGEILLLLNMGFLKWIFIAFILAIPIAFISIHKWLESFAFKTNLSWWIFAVSGLLALSIALLTISWQSWKAATRNPVEALRYE